MEITIKFKGVDLDVDFDYQPFEKADTGPEARYPGCVEAITGINEIQHKGTCFLEVFENDMGAIEVEILNQLNCLI